MKGPITQLLKQRAAGDASVDAQLLPLIYAELHALAERHMRHERDGHSLSPTDLMHEAWLRLGGLGEVEDRRQFFALAARRMRQVLVDHARRRNADKRGGGVEALTLDAFEPNADRTSDTIDMLALEQALSELEAQDARKARVVELRYFAGLEMNEIAELLNLSRATVLRDWDVARAFLRLRLD